MNKAFRNVYQRIERLFLVNVFRDLIILTSADGAEEADDLAQDDTIFDQNRSQ